MNNFSDIHASIYEQPVDERIRKFLRFENIYMKINNHKDIDSKYDAYSVLLNISELFINLTRSEIKRDLISEIETHKVRYQEYIKFDGADKIKLNSIMEKQNAILKTLHDLEANYLNVLKRDELLQTIIKHINTSCADLEYWLSRDHDFRKNQINLWLELIKPIENSIFFCLDLLRKSTEILEITAKDGMYLFKMDTEKKIRLLRVTMKTDNYFFPKISVGPQRATIAFMTIDDNNKIIRLNQDINFVLDICYI
ncbi:MAG: cell division protein ZapD [Gammaproteobacteria bacterium]